MYPRAAGDGDAADWRSPPQTYDMLTNGFVGYGNVAFELEFLHVAVAQVKREESQTPWLTIAAESSDSCSVGWGGKSGYLSCGSIHP